MRTFSLHALWIITHSHVERDTIPSSIYGCRCRCYLTLIFMYIKHNVIILLAKLELYHLLNLTVRCLSPCCSDCALCYIHSVSPSCVSESRCTIPAPMQLSPGPHPPVSSCQLANRPAIISYKPGPVPDLYFVALSKQRTGRQQTERHELMHCSG